MSRDYIYAVARIRAKELALLDRQDMEQLLSCRSYEDCLRVLADKGWGPAGSDAEALLSGEEEKTWALIRELTDDLAPFSLLLYPTDFNNLKAAIKCVVGNTEPHRVFLPGGAVEPETILRAVREKDFSLLPAEMAPAAEEVYPLFLETQDGQLCDVILDRFCLLAIQKAGKASKEPVLENYAELFCALSDIKIAVRACKTKKSLQFIASALAPCETLDVDALARAACAGLEELYAYLSRTVYEEAAGALKESYSVFEKWCDDRVMALVQDQKSEFFTVGPLFAYVVARRSEIASVRVILSGKLNELNDTMIRERVREMYV